MDYHDKCAYRCIADGEGEERVTAKGRRGLHLLIVYILCFTLRSTSEPLHRVGNLALDGVGDSVLILE